MIGVSKSILGKGAGVSALDAYVYPSYISENAGYGSYTTPIIEVFPSGGLSPYTYQWSVTGNMTVTNPMDKKTRVATGGYNEVVEGVLTCVVTDSALATKTINIDIEIIFSGGFR